MPRQHRYLFLHSVKPSHGAVALRLHTLKQLDGGITELAAQKKSHKHRSNKQPQDMEFM